MKEYIFKRPMLLCGLICCIISVTGYYSENSLMLSGALIAVILGTAILKRIKPQLIFSLLISFIMVVSTLITLSNARNLSAADKLTETAEITVYKVTDNKSDFCTAEAYVTESCILKYGSKLSVSYKGFPLKAGQTVKARLKYSAVSDEHRKSYFYGEGIYLFANAENIVITGQNNILTAAERVRKYIRTALFSNLGYNEAATLCALVYGDKSYFTDEFYSNVKGAGVSHVMVVSGMHLSVLVMFFTYIIEKLAYNRYLKAFAILAVVILLSVLCGFTMSVMRAGIAYVIMAAGILLKRKTDPVNCLGAATVLILVFSPFAIFSVSLQLSLLSTFGILAAAVPVTNHISENGTISSGFVLSVISAILITLSAILLTLPVTIYRFGYISTVAVITNLLIAYPVTLLLGYAVVALGLNLVSPTAARPVFILCNGILKYVNFVINRFGSHPLSTAELPYIFVIFSIILILIVFRLLLACEKRVRMIKSRQITEKTKTEGVRRKKWR